MKKRLMTLEDLYSYYSSNTKSSHFSAKDEGDTIVVQVGGNMRFEDNSSIEGLSPVTLKACHDMNNINGSFISKESLESALPSFSNRPILGYIHQVNGQYEFYDHRMHLNEDDELVYDEFPVGIITESCNAHLEYDENVGKDRVVVNGYIFDEYSHAKEIIEREGECPVSVELSIRELSYNAKEKRLDIENFYFSGVTILGKNPDGEVVRPGMEGSNIKLADFKHKNSETCFSESNVIEMLEKISDKLDIISNFTIDNSKEGGKTTMTKFEELLEQYGKTVEEIEFEYEGLSDEELEVAFAEAFNEPAEGDDGDAGEEAPASEDDTEADPDEPVDEENDEGDEAEEKFTKTFEISHDDIRYALYNLLASYEESDNEWYYISAVYDNHFVYEGYCKNAIYGQNYIKDGDNVSFEGERYNLHRELLTDSEYANLEAMRTNYSSISEKLAKYESEPEKMNIINSEDYSQISETDEFKAFAKRDAHFDMSVEDVKAKMDEMLLAFAKSGNLNFSSIQNNEVSRKGLPASSKKTSRYGTLFSK